MSLKKTVESLAQNAVSTATTAVRHPLGTAAKVKDTAGAGIGLVRNRIGHAPAQAPSPDREKGDAQKNVESAVAEVKEVVTEKAQDVVAKVEKAAPAVKKAATPKKTPAAKKAPAEAPAPAVKKDPAAPEAPAPAEAPVAKKAPAAKKATVDKKAPAAKKPAAKKAAPQKPVEDDPRDHIPGPDLATFEPAVAEDLPEPIVIVADDKPTS